MRRFQPFAGPRWNGWSRPFPPFPGGNPDAPEGWKSGSSRFARLTMSLFQSGHCRLEPTTPDTAPISAPLVGRRAEDFLGLPGGGSAPGSDRDTGLWAPAALIADDLLKSSSKTNGTNGHAKTKKKPGRKTAADVYAD